MSVAFDVSLPLCHDLCTPFCHDLCSPTTADPKNRGRASGILLLRYGRTH